MRDLSSCKLLFYNYNRNIEYFLFIFLCGESRVIIYFVANGINPGIKPAIIYIIANGTLYWVLEKTKVDQ